MPELETSSARPPGGAPAELSVPLTVGAAVLVGVGLLTIAYWLITFRWIYFGGVGLLAAGGLLLFTRATGPDRA